MPLKPGKSKEAFRFNFLELLKSGRPKKQAFAIAYDKQRGGKKKRRKKRG